LELVQHGADGNLAYVLSGWTLKKVGGGPNNNEESNSSGTHFTGAFEAE
jgi:hypothetical protein